MNIPSKNEIEIGGLKFGKVVYAVIPRFERKPCGVCGGSGSVKAVIDGKEYENVDCPANCIFGEIPYLTEFYTKKTTVCSIGISSEITVYTGLSHENMLSEIFLTKKEAENECDIRNNKLPPGGLLGFGYTGILHWDGD